METQQLPGDRDSAQPPVDDEVAAAPSRSFGVPWRGSRRVKEIAVLVGVCALAIVLLNRFVAQPFTIPSGSMENTLSVGDRVLVDKLSYAFGGTPHRGDVVVFDGRGSFVDTETQAATPTGGDGSGNDFVKRVIGVAGDTVKCCDAQGRITVDGVPLDESAYLHPGVKPSDFPFVVVVPAGKLFVLGDNRAVSADSRDHLGDPGGGFVPVSRVIGRAAWVILPVGHWRSLDRPQVFAELDRAIAAAGAGGGARGHQG